MAEPPAERIVSFPSPARHIDASNQSDQANGQYCLTDAEGGIGQAGHLDEKARRQWIGKKHQGLDRPAGQRPRLVSQDRIEVKGDSDERPDLARRPQHQRTR